MDRRSHSDTLYANKFVNCAGCVLFVPPHPESGRFTTNVCLIHHRNRHNTVEVLLPKGRKDQGENISDTAVRETYEETGISCSLMPAVLVTRAPPTSTIGSSQRECARLARNCTEPFAVTIRNMRNSTKIIYWFVGQADLQNDGQPVVHANTQMADENYETFFYHLDIDMMDEREVNTAVEPLTFHEDRDLVKEAIYIVYKTHPEWFPRTASPSPPEPGRTNLD